MEIFLIKIKEFKDWEKTMGVFWEIFASIYVYYVGEVVEEDAFTHIESNRKKIEENKEMTESRELGLRRIINN